MQNTDLQNSEYWDLLEKFIIEPYSKQNYKQLSKSTNELFFKNQITNKTYGKLIEIFTSLHIEHRITLKFENKMNSWDEQFTYSIKRYREKLFEQEKNYR